MPTESDLYEIEALDGEVVPAPHQRPEPTRAERLEPTRAERLEPTRTERLPGRIGQPGVQAAMAVATGFVAGAATIALLRRYGQGRLEGAAAMAALEPPRPGPPRPGQPRTYLVQVRQLE